MCLGHQADSAAFSALFKEHGNNLRLIQRGLVPPRSMSGTNSTPPTQSNWFDPCCVSHAPVPLPTFRTDVLHFYYSTYKNTPEYKQLKALKPKS